MALTTDQSSTIDEAVIEALRARTRRYDVAIDDGLVLSVLPNGVKAWTWVYDDPADPHRKTLGIYPDMSIDDARKSLASEKESYRRASSKNPEFVIRDGRIQSTHPPSRLPVIVGAIAALIALAVIVYLFVASLPDSAESETTTEVADGPPAMTEQTQNTSLQPSAGPPPRPELANPDETVVAAAETPGQTVTPTAPNEPEPTPPPDTAPPEATNVVTSAGPFDRNQQNDNLIPQAATPASASASAPASGPASAPAAPNAARREAVTAADEARLQVTVSTTPNEPVPPEPATRVGTLVPGLNAGRIADPRVFRGHLTTAVNAREPVDDLGFGIVGDGTDLQTYYFFTELRRLGGERVRHRWLHRDRVIAEIPFNIGEAWRWRVYSSKTFLPSMTGQWHVQVLLDDDTVIYSLPFTFTP